MEVNLTPEKEAQLEQRAAWSRRNTSQVIEEALDRLLEEDAAFRSAVQQGLDSLDRGEYLTEEEMAARVQEMLRD